MSEPSATSERARPDCDERHDSKRRRTHRLVRCLVDVLIVGTLSICAVATAQTQRLDFVLNWVPAGEFAPYYYARQRGWYEEAGIDLRFEFGRGSAFVVQKIGAGMNPVGVADLATALVTAGKGADLVAVFNIYANSAHGVYWLKSSGITGPKDFAGRKIGAPAADGVRVMWPAFAKAAGIDPDSVTWVNIDANAKLASLQGKVVDIIPSFYNRHYLFRRELGADMGFLAWRDIGLNPYGNSIVVNGKFLQANRALIDRFVKVTQRAFLACVLTPEACVAALIDRHPALRFDDELQNWKLVVELMNDRSSRNAALGSHDAVRMRSDYGLARDYVGIDTEYDVGKIYTNEFLDPAVRIP